MADLPRVFPHATFFNFYTSTETYPARVATRYDPARPESVGKPVGTTSVRVLTSGGAPAAPGEAGEVWLRAGNAPPRRVLDDDGSQPTTVRDGWTRTGDLGYVDSEGYLYLTGRTSDVVIVGGTNVSTGRVEQTLARHEAVAEAAACGIDHPVLGEIVVAFVVPRMDVTVRQLREHAVSGLARHEVPAIIRVVDELPRNAAGKVVKRELPALLETPGAAEFVAPRNDVERHIASVWASVLQVGAVGVTDNFFEIGGDSLAATRIAAALAEQHGLRVDAVDVLEAASVAELATYWPATVDANQAVPTRQG
jgi:acyl-CoA synthetase (AMP-forming)/AMP-acid ligase II